MSGIIGATNIGEMLVVDRADILCNKGSIKDACDSIGPRMYQLEAAQRSVTIHPSAYEHKPEEFAKIRIDTRRNEAMHEAIRSAYEKICEHYEEIDRIYKNKVVKFKNKDDEHEESIKALHTKYTSAGEGCRELKEGASDSVAENGWTYGAGEIAPDVVLAFVGAKGLDKTLRGGQITNNATRATSTVDNIADVSKIEKFDDLSDISKAGKVDDVSKVAAAAKVEGRLNANLLDELANTGAKYNPDDIVAITKNADGELVWLEKGDSKSGLEHIMQHVDQFAAKGISSDKIPELIMHALEDGKVVGTQRTRIIYEVMYEGELQRVAISVGDNGYIVGANPKSIP